MPEQGTHAPSPAPDLIPAETKNQLGDSHRDWYSKRGHFSPNTRIVERREQPRNSLKGFATPSCILGPAAHRFHHHPHHVRAHHARAHAHTAWTRRSVVGNCRVGGLLHLRGRRRRGLLSDTSAREH